MAIVEDEDRLQNNHGNLTDLVYYSSEVTDDARLLLLWPT
jgi:hypothetical protein